MSVVGLDLGTSGVRAVAFSDDGTVLAQASAPLALHRHGRGSAELDGEEILASAEEVVRSAARGAADAGDAVRAVGLSVLGEAVAPINRAGHPTAPVAVSMDTRGNDPADELGARLGADRFSAITGQPLHGMFSVFKIMAGDERWRAAAGFRCVGDLVAERWTGVAAIDFAQAARTGLFDVDAAAWSEEILSAAGEIAPWVDAARFAEPVPAGTVIGRISADAASRLGLDEGVPLVAGAHDQAAAYLGAGGAPGIRSVIAFGSSDCMTVGTATRPRGLEGTGFATYRVDADLWVTLAGTAAGGWALEWLSGLLGREVSDVFGALAPVPPALLFLPYLAGSGTLDNDPGARGVLHGLTLDTSIPEIARAVVEGAGYEFWKIASAFRERSVDVGELRVTGSGAENAAALSARADASGLSLTPVPNDASARGAAMLAMRAIGGDPSRLTPFVDEGGAVTPDAETQTWHTGQRSAYVDLYESTRRIAAHLASHPELPQQSSH